MSGNPLFGFKLFFFLIVHEIIQPVQWVKHVYQIFFHDFEPIALVRLLGNREGNSSRLLHLPAGATSAASLRRNVSLSTP